jgi:hypothetical protein
MAGIVDSRSGNTRAARGGAHRAATVMLSVTLATQCGLLPLFSLFHLAFADHDHRFCSEHRQVEDVPALDHGARALSAFTARTAAAWSRSPAASSPLAHLACHVLNGTIAREPVALAVTPIPAARVGGETMPAREQGRAPERPLLLSAPKTSPPSVAV